MHVVSDDERREVARRLRELADYCDENEMSLSDDDWPGVLSDYIWPEDGGYHTYDEDCRRLADLIEPEPERTCRVESSHEEEGDGCYSYFEYELSCGHEIAWGDQLPPSYCPECGRRVLYDSNDYI